MSESRRYSTPGESHPTDALSAFLAADHLREQGMRISELIEVTQRVTVQLGLLWDRLGLAQRRAA